MCIHLLACIMCFDRKLNAAAFFQSAMMMQYQNLSHVVGDEPDFMTRVQGSFFRAKDHAIYEEICQPSGDASDAYLPYTLSSANSTHMGCHVAGPDMNGAYWMSVIFATSDGSELGSEYNSDPSSTAANDASLSTTNMQEALQAELKQKLQDSLSKAMAQGPSMQPPGSPSASPTGGQMAPVFSSNDMPLANNFGLSSFGNFQPMAFGPTTF